MLAAVPSTSAQAIDSRCTVDGYTPWTDGVYVKSQSTLTCTAAVGEKTGVLLEYQDLLSWPDLGGWTYSAASAGSKYLTSPVKSANCNGTGTRTYRAQFMGRSTDDTTRTVVSASKKLTC